MKKRRRTRSVHENRNNLHLLSYGFFFHLEKNKTQSDSHSDLVGKFVIVQLSSENISFTCFEFLKKCSQFSVVFGI